MYIHVIMLTSQAILLCWTNLKYIIVNQLIIYIAVRNEALNI